jgi:protein-tyrosine phosphatase
MNKIKMVYLFVVCQFILTNCQEVKESEVRTNESHTMHPIEKENLLNQSDSNTYRIFSFEVGQNFVAISPLPGKVSLSQDIATIKAQGISNVITLVSEEELASKNLQHFMQEMDNAGIEVYHSPIKDYGLPSQGQMDSISDYLNTCLAKNKNVLVHCMGGFGRSGTVMGCYAKRHLNQPNPIQYVRDTRGQDAIETEEQEKFVLTY